MRKQKPLPLPFEAGRILFCACALAAALGSAAVAARAQQTTDTLSAPAGGGVGAARVPVSQAEDRYRIGVGDVLEVRVFNRPQLSREAVRVEGNGLIRMPLIETEIQAACRTESELAQEIARLYLEYQKNPQVDVFVKEYNSQPVAVMGAVNTPGRFQLQRRVRLLELLAFAGGPAERAGRTVQVIHNAPSFTCDTPAASASAEAAPVNSYRLNDLMQGDARSNPYVRPGDVVTITEAEQAFVVGNVLKPSTIPLKDKITVSQAIAMAGGALPDTQSNRVRVIRSDPRSGSKMEIPVDLKAVRAHQSEDIALQANDIVEVPVAGGKRFWRNLLNGLVPSAARLPIQVIR
ncbi:MAG TPA: polysaccharide biosynthesis/export family protein [Pyrinomonadaceae bacterium]|nr:polysaccharide biosynthesis/export family protein [Pyrinomonadaceae bacterium]